MSVSAIPAFLREGLGGRFVAQGVPQDRVICMGSTERRDHLVAFENIDISLDPFPQNGGISTWESLYMGVPVVAKLGNGASSRADAAILKAVGLDDWVADSAPANSRTSSPAAERLGGNSR